MLVSSVNIKYDKIVSVGYLALRLRLAQVETVIYGIPNGAGNVIQHICDDETEAFVLSTEDPRQNVVKSNIVKLWYHHDHLGSTDYLTDNIDGKVVSYVSGLSLIARLY